MYKDALDKYFAELNKTQEAKKPKHIERYRIMEDDYTVSEYVVSGPIYWYHTLAEAEEKLSQLKKNPDPFFCFYIEEYNEEWDDWSSVYYEEDLVEAELPF